jgi:pimeloyl-ACP methyl ester carboxylesterase
MSGARRRTPQEYVDVAYRGRPRPEPAAWLLRAARTALYERPCWLARLALEPLATAGFPKLVIVGTWDTVPPGYRPGMADVMRTVSATVAARIGGRLVGVPAAAHEPQREHPEAVNQLLADIWSAGDATAR